MENSNKKLTLMAFVLMMLTSVFGVANIGIGFYRMGYAAILMFVTAGIFYFLPFIMMMIELATGFKNNPGGIFTWMEKSVSLKFAFVGIMMWYSSYIIWMFGKVLSIWVPLSFAILGKDVTVNAVMIKGIDFGPFILGMIGILAMIVLTKVVSGGTEKLSKITNIGGLTVVVLNLILMVGGVFAIVRNITNGYVFKETLNMTSLVTSPNPEFQSALPFLGFMVFAVFAYGGVEAIAGVANDLEDPERDLKRGIFLSGMFIVVAYAIGFFMVGAALKWSDFGDNVSSLSALFLIMGHLGDSIVGVDGSFLGKIFIVFSGWGIFLTYLGALAALAYAPLKQLIEGTPKEFWPKSFQTVNENGVRVSALKVQSAIVIIFVAVKSIFSLFDPAGAKQLFDLIITMTNVGMTIPYLFLIIAWYKFRMNDNLEKDLILIKSKTMIIVSLISTVALVSFGNIFTIISPFLSHNISVGVWTIIGPIIFSIVALIIYAIGNSKMEKSEGN